MAERKKEAKTMKNYSKIKTHYKREEMKSQADEIALIRNNWETFSQGWRYKKLLTKRQQQKPVKEQKALCIEKIKLEYAQRIFDFNEKADKIAKSQPLKEIYINVEWNKSRTWGMCPRAEVWAGGYFTGYASGFGYDKLSSAIADALNQSERALKIVYDLYEKELSKNPNATPHSVAYGMGYIHPYYEGGVGYNCFKSIFDLAKAKSNEWRETKTSDIMIVRF